MTVMFPQITITQNLNICRNDDDVCLQIDNDMDGGMETHLTVAQIQVLIDQLEVLKNDIAERDRNAIERGGK